MKSVSIVVGMISVGAMLVFGATGCSSSPDDPSPDTAPAVELKSPGLQPQGPRLCEYYCPNDPNVDVVGQCNAVNARSCQSRCSVPCEVVNL